MPDLIIIPPAVPEGFCNTLTGDWVQQLANFIVGKAVAKFEGVGTIILDQDTQPDPTQQGFLWRPPSRGMVFKYSGGAWITPHLYPPNGSGASGPRIWFEGSEADLWSFDGGDGTNPSIYAPSDAAASAGPMWVVDHNYDGRIPMGAGDIAGTTPVKTLAVSENYGEGQHTLTAEENAPHSHGTQNTGDSFATLKAGSGGAQDNTGLRTVVDGATGTNGWLGSYPQTGISGGDATTHDPKGHQNVPPVRGGFWARRSARVNYTAS